MTVTHYRGHIVVCPNCGHESRAETIIVARDKDRAHGVECDARRKKEADAVAADRAQGKLF